MAKLKKKTNGSSGINPGQNLGSSFATTRQGYSARSSMNNSVDTSKEVVGKLNLKKLRTQPTKGQKLKMEL